MLQIVNEQLHRLMYLRDVVIPWMEQHPERVDLDDISSSCGTYRCLLGWAATHADIFPGVETLFLCNEPFEALDRVIELTGLTRSDCDELFGDSWMGTLADRKAYLEQLIEERVTQLA